MAKILVVDDEALVRSMARTALQRAGHEVHEAANGADALALLGREKVDLAIIDLIMPEMQGLETIMQIRAQGHQVKVIAASGGGAARLDLLPLAVKSGADFTIAKPFDVAELTALVQRALS